MRAHVRRIARTDADRVLQERAINTGAVNDGLTSTGRGTWPRERQHHRPIGMTRVWSSHGVAMSRL
jgi:hypothetical protein